MPALRSLVSILLLSSLSLAPRATSVQAAPDPTPKAAANAERDGQHDFDFELGSWNIHLQKLMHPLIGSKEWVRFDGTSVTRKVWDGRSQLEEFETNGAAGRLEGLTLRLYNPQSHEWSLYWANSKVGKMDPPQ